MHSESDDEDDGDDKPVRERWDLEFRFTIQTSNE